MGKEFLFNVKRYRLYHVPLANIALPAYTPHWGRKAVKRFPAFVGFLDQISFQALLLMVKVPLDLQQREAIGVTIHHSEQRLGIKYGRSS